MWEPELACVHTVWERELACVHTVWEHELACAHAVWHHCRCSEGGIEQTLGINQVSGGRVEVWVEVSHQVLAKTGGWGHTQACEEVGRPGGQERGCP